MVSHQSVLLKQAVDALVTDSDGTYLDCTGGAGGHSQEILERLSEKGRLYICDYHSETVDLLKQRFASDARATVLQSRFSQVFDNLNFPFSGVLADFGISSMQLDDEALGIGFLVDDVPLDMRISHDAEETAAEILKTRSEEALADLFYHYGGETAARRLARIIVADRKEGRFFETTKEFRELCERVLGRFYRGRKIHPATKVFQALRIAVNGELDEVEKLLAVAPQKLSVGGRLVLISFHSGEDRLVKRTFKELGFQKDYRLVSKKAIKPDDEEVKENVRARSARMRVLERCEGGS